MDLADRGALVRSARQVSQPQHLLATIDLIAPENPVRTRPVQDERKLRRYRRRWKVERTLAWLGNYRRLVVRYENKLHVYSASFHLPAS